MQGAGRIRKEAPSRSSVSADSDTLSFENLQTKWVSVFEGFWGTLGDKIWASQLFNNIQHIQTLSPPEANRKARTWQTDKIGDLSHLQTRGIVMVTGVQNHVTFTHSHIYYDYDMDLWGLKFCRAVVTSICRRTTVIMDMEQDDTTWNNTK